MMRFQVNVADYGAAADGRLQTESIQSAINACREAGGGEVLIPEGDFHVGSLRLYSNITLHLLENARLIGSDNWKDYTNFHLPTTLGYVTDPYFIKLWHLPDHYTNAVITAFRARNVTIIGEKGSEINGSNCFDPTGEEEFRGPMGIVLSSCENVTLSGYTFVDAANWSHQIDSCKNVLLTGITVKAGHDGFNIHHCTNVTVDNCDLQTGDDCIAGYDVHNFHMHDSKLNTACNSLRIGCNNLLVERCYFYGPSVYPHRISKRHNTLCAFEYYSHEADEIRDINNHWTIRDCTFEGLETLIHYEFGDAIRLQVNKPLEDVLFENVRIRGLRLPSDFKGCKDVTGTLTFRNASIDFSEDAESLTFMRMNPYAELRLENVNFEKEEIGVETPDRAMLHMSGGTPFRVLP